MLSAILLLLHLNFYVGYSQAPIEKLHDPERYREPLNPIINGSVPPQTIAPPYNTPDYRIQEPPFIAYKETYIEEERPYRMSPFYKAFMAYQASQAYKDDPQLFGCYCCTVYKRLTPLAGCAIITTRHVLTTASSTEMVLRENRKIKTLENILGVWYDVNVETFNSSFYASVARIHYHPRYIRPHMVNASHPFPMCNYDLAVYAATYRFYGSYFTTARAYICNRGGAWWWYIEHGVPRYGQLQIIAGYQFIKAYRKNPMPWYKYIVKTRKVISPCPKTEWGWFFCIAIPWARYGLDSGAAMHRALEGNSWMYDGLIGMHAFSMKLRSQTMVGYFTALDCHPVLDWLYSAYMGRQQYEWLDWRFYDSQWQAPVAKPWFYVPWVYPVGDETYAGTQYIFNR